MFEELTPIELQRLKLRGELWQLLDVREPWEVELARVDGTLNIPMGELPARLAELDREQPVAVLCHSGGRSAQVAFLLARSGFARVANITGGIDAWALELDHAIPRY